MKDYHDAPRDECRGAAPRDLRGRMTDVDIDREIKRRMGERSDRELAEQARDLEQLVAGYA